MSEHDDFIVFHEALMKLSHSARFLAKTRSQKMLALLKMCAERLQVDRVSAWRLSDQGKAMRCELLYEIKHRAATTPSTVLTAERYPDYFAALASSRLIDATDARTDPRTHSMADQYLGPMGVHSMLDAPIYTAGQISGAICLESFKQRDWSVALMSFVSAIADTISLMNTHDAWRVSEDQLNYVTHVDELTGLDNRQSVQEYIKHLIAISGDRTPFYALWLDVDRLKAINEGIGKHMGDRVLAELAHRFRDHPLNSKTAVARFGGDEFIIILCDQADDAAALENAEQLLATCSRPLVMDKHRLNVTASVGIVRYPADSQDATTLLHYAETAMYQAKALGRNQAQLFSRDITANFQSRFQLETDLQQAIIQSTLAVHYQPIMDRHGHTVVALEALVRWQHPTRGLLAPIEFLSLAQEAGLMQALGERVLDQVCADIRVSAQAGRPLPKVAVNLASEQIADPRLPDKVADCLAAHGISGSALSFEVIEDQLKGESCTLARTLNRLTEQGIELAIDDFGTGYSSLERLKHMPFVRLKVDRSFVTDIPGDSNDCAIARSILGLAEGLEMEVVAEGIETEAQLTWLQAQGCQYLQGYYFARPAPLPEIMPMLYPGQAAHGNFKSA